jgi:hypothetical protein
MCNYAFRNLVHEPNLYAAAGHSAHTHMHRRGTFHKDLCDSACPTATWGRPYHRQTFSTPTMEGFFASLTGLQVQIYPIPTRVKLKVDNKADKRETTKTISQNNVTRV